MRYHTKVSPHVFVGIRGGVRQEDVKVAIRQREVSRHEVCVRGGVRQRGVLAVSVSICVCCCVVHLRLRCVNLCALCEVVVIMLALFHNPPTAARAAAGAIR